MVGRFSTIPYGVVILKFGTRNNRGPPKITILKKLHFFWNLFGQILAQIYPDLRRPLKSVDFLTGIANIQTVTSLTSNSRPVLSEFRTRRLKKFALFLLVLIIDHFSSLYVTFLSGKREEQITNNNTAHCSTLVRRNQLTRSRITSFSLCNRVHSNSYRDS